MNKFIKEQLITLKNITIKHNGKVISMDELDDDMLEFEITPYTEGPLELNTVYTFVFEGYMTKLNSNTNFHIQWNKGVTIPFRVMKGTVVKYLHDMAYIKCVGVPNYATAICSKCLKPGAFTTICNNCLNELNITDQEQLRGITWEGWVPLNAIREAKC